MMNLSRFESSTSFAETAMRLAPLGGFGLFGAANLLMQLRQRGALKYSLCQLIVKCLQRSNKQRSRVAYLRHLCRSVTLLQTWAKTK